MPNFRIFSHRRVVKYRESIIFVDVFVLNMTWTHCEVYWDLDFEPFENEWRAVSGIEGLSVFGLKVIFWPGF